MRLALLSFVMISVCTTVGAQVFRAPAVVVTEEPFHQLLLENQFARVFRLEVPPRKETLIHRHDRDFVRISLVDSEANFTKAGRAPIARSLQMGHTQFITVRPQESIRNEDSFQTLRVLEVEVLKPGMRPGQAYDFATIQAKLYDSITLPADPKAYYVVSHETPTVDGFDIQLLRQQSYKPRLQGRPALLVAITDLDLSGTTQTASSVEVQLSAGDVEWIDPATAPVELLNRSESPVRFILLVFK